MQRCCFDTATVVSSDAWLRSVWAAWLGGMPQSLLLDSVQAQERSAQLRNSS